MKIFKSTSTMQVSLTGLNYERFLQFLKQNNCVLYNVSKPDYKTLTFTISVADYKKIMKLNGFRNYNVKVEKERGLYFFIKNFKVKIGLLTGIIVTGLVFSFFSMFTFNINISGNNDIKTQEIISVLNQNNVKIGKINVFDNNKIELLLKENFNDISLVSVIKQGTNIVINIKEKQKIYDDDFQDIIAPTNIIITSLVVNQGYAERKVGDIVKKGDVIVGANAMSNGEKVPCKPLATLEAEAYYLGQTFFETKEVTYVKTNKKAVSSRLEFLNFRFLETSKSHNFKHFKTEIMNRFLFTNNFLPIKIYKETVYELKEKVTIYNFEKEKDKLVAKSKALAYNLIPENETVLEENLVISLLNTKYIVQTVLKTNLTITFS